MPGLVQVNFARLRVPGSQRHIPTPKVLKYPPPGSIKRTCLGVLVYLQEPMMGSWYLSKQMWQSGFFLSRSHIGRDSGFSSKIGRILTRDRDGWTVWISDWKTTREVKVTLPFSCLMFKFSFICNYYNIYVILRLKFERTKLAFLKTKHSFIFCL